MLVKSDSEKEKKIVEDIITNDEQLKQQHELFVAEMAFKQEMINARKTLSLTQKDVSRLSGLSQQAVSRIENGASGTISTVRVEFYSKKRLPGLGKYFQSAQVFCRFHQSKIFHLLLFLHRSRFTLH